MFKRQPDLRRICPVCGKRIDENRTRYCDNCEGDFTGSTDPPTYVVPSRANRPVSLGALLARLEGRYVVVNLTEADKFERVLLVLAGADYLTLSARRSLIHMPLAAVVSLVEPVRGLLDPAMSSDEYVSVPLVPSDLLPVLVLRHEYVPKGGTGWWVGLSVPLG